MKKLMLTMLILAALLLAVQVPAMAQCLTTGAVTMTDSDQVADPNAAPE